MTFPTACAGWIIASIFYAYQYVVRVMPSIMMRDILEQFSIDTATFGQFSGAYYVGYSLAHIPLGFMLDRFGAKKVMSVCIGLTTIGLLPLIWTNFWIYPIIGRMLTGIGSSAAILGTFNIIRLTFAEERFTRMLSISVTIGLMGALYGGGPVNYFCSAYGYQTVIKALCIIGWILAILAYAIIPQSRINKSISIYASIKHIIQTPATMIICFLSGLLVGPLEGFADVWGTEFLKIVYGFEGTIAASLPSLMFVGMCFGGPFLSIIAEKSGAYLATIAAAGAVMAASFFAVLTGTLSVTVMSILFVAVGVCCAYQIVAIYKASTYVKEYATGLATAVANMIIMIFGYFFHASIGWVIKATPGSQAHAFTYGIAVIPIAIVIGVAGFILLWLYEHKLIVTRKR